MKMIIGLLLIVNSMQLHAQYTPEAFTDEELELLEIIKGDEDLTDYYRSGVRKLKNAKIWGITSLTFLGTGIVGIKLMDNSIIDDKYHTDNYYVGLYMLALSIPLALLQETKPYLQTQRKKTDKGCFRCR